MRPRERFAPARMRLVTEDIARRVALRAQRLSPRRALRASMSRATSPHSDRHRRLQEHYRLHRVRRFLPKEVRRGGLAFDIGANVGEWSAAMRGKGATVIAVEPQAACIAALRARFAADPNVRVVESAVGDHVGTGALRPTTTSSEHASMSPEWREIAIAEGYMPEGVWLDPVDVPLTTLDVLISEHGSPEFCKIDVEGFEPQVLRGLSQPLPTLAFEFHRELPGAVDECVGLLAGLGEYRYRIFVGEWPDREGKEAGASDLAARIEALEPGTLGMIRARHV